jgi:hypothetical protein
MEAQDDGQQRQYEHNKAKLRIQAQGEQEPSG